MPCRKFGRRNAIHVLVPYSKTQHKNALPPPDEEEDDYSPSLAYTFARTSIHDGSVDPDYSPASRPKNPFDEHSCCNNSSSSKIGHLLFLEMEDDDEDEQSSNGDSQYRGSTSSSLSSPPTSPSPSHLYHKKRRTVRFDESRNVYHENTQDPCYSLWYSRDETKRLYAAHADAMHEIAVGDEMHHHHHADPFSYRKVLQRTYEACCRVVHETDDPGVLTPVEQEHLRQCFAANTSRIGMECTMAVPAIVLDEHSRYYELLNVVTNNYHSSSAKRSRDGQDECIRAACEALSRPSRLFARHVAQAQAAASGV